MTTSEASPKFSIAAMNQSKPVIVLVPGAFLGAGPYASVAECLRTDGFLVEVIDLPSAIDLSSETVSSPKWKELAAKTVESDISAIREVLDPHFEQDRRVMVVGHSYGSIPAMLSIEGNTVKERKLQGLQGGITAFVNIAGFAFGARGKNAMGTDEDPPPMPYHKYEVCTICLSDPYRAFKLIEQDGVVTLQESAKPLFFSDMSDEEQAQVWPTFPKQQSWACFLCKPTFIDSDVKIPKAYVKTEKDQCVYPEWQAGFIAAGGYQEIPMTTGHCPMISMPKELARVIAEFAGNVFE
ncbi:hypothetical protein ACHAPU_006062 [Fusarium lateritium]